MEKKEENQLKVSDNNVLLEINYEKKDLEHLMTLLTQVKITLLRYTVPSLLPVLTLNRN